MKAPHLLLALFFFTPPTVHIQVTDLTPKFLRFYEAAQQQHADEAQRWQLWKQMVDFAAVPPTPEGEKMARKMLDDAWPRYPQVMTEIRAGAKGIQPPPESIVQSVATLLKATVPIDLKLAVFVGNFDDNAFTAPGKDQVPTVAVPVEAPEKGRLLAHEFTHVVEAEQAHLSLDWQRSIAHTIFVEGLAMRATASLYPGLAPKDYIVETSPGWYDKAREREAQIIADIQPHVDASDSDSVMRYTMGTGGAGIDREAYYVGWIVIGDLLQHGWDFSRLARVQDAEMPKLVQESLNRLAPHQTR